MKIQLPPLKFKMEIPVMIEHVNYGGHLGNDSVLSLLHEARIRYLNQQNLAETNPYFALYMIECHIQYISEAHYGDIILAYVGADKIKRSFCDFYYQFWHQQEKREIARATTKMAFIDRKKNQMTIPPEGMLSLKIE
jgi:acyl-CoA thioesterase FadM